MRKKNKKPIPTPVDKISKEKIIGQIQIHWMTIKKNLLHWGNKNEKKHILKSKNIQGCKISNMKLLKNRYTQSNLSCRQPPNNDQLPTTATDFGTHTECF